LLNDEIISTAQSKYTGDIKVPKIVNHEKMRSEIARKAIALLAKKGFQATTIQDIANAAGVGKGTIYHYFRTKEEILLVVSNELFYEMERSFGAALLRIDDPLDKMAALIEEAMHVNEDVENIFIVYTELWLINVHSHKYQDFVGVIKKMHHDLTALVSNMIDAGKNRGRWDRDTDSQALACYLVSSFDGVIAHYMIDKEKIDIKKVTKEFIRFLLQRGAPRK